MSEENEIPPIDEDRGSLNIGKTKNKTKNKKNIIIGSIVIGTLTIVAGIVIFSLVGGNKNTASLNTDLANVQAATYSDSGIKQAQDQIIERLNYSNIIKTVNDKKDIEIADEKNDKSNDVDDKKIATIPPVFIDLNKTDKNGKKCKEFNDHGICPLTLNEIKRSGSIMFDLNNGGGGGDTTSSTIVDNQTYAENNDYDDSLDSKTFKKGSVSRYKDQSFTMIHGTNIPIVLKTRIVTDYAGLITAQVTKDIYSMNGAVKLIGRGSKVFGIQKKAMTQGIARVFIQWTNIITPLGVSINIDSLGTGQLGASGASAWIDGHFKERFGNSILLSFIEDLVKTGTNNIQDSSVSFDSSSDNMDSMAKVALENSINIKPTAYINIGSRMNILLARDIDFSSIYSLEKIN